MQPGQFSETFLERDHIIERSPLREVASRIAQTYALSKRLLNRKYSYRLAAFCGTRDLWGLVHKLQYERRNEPAEIHLKIHAGLLLPVRLRRHFRIHVLSKGLGLRALKTL